jgi:hypothetical protein
MPTFRKRPVEIEAYCWDGSPESAKNIIECGSKHMAATRF